MMLTGCAGDSLIMEPTRTITLTRAAWIQIDPALYEPLAMPPFPTDPVTNGDLNDYKRAAEQVIMRCNLDRMTISTTQAKMK